jgi:hypothetical protein
LPWFPRKAQESRASVEVRRPLGRSDDLITEQVADELLVYDRSSKRAHCLSATAARVWLACDGKSDLAAISGELDMAPELVREAVDELEAAHLLDRGLEVVNVGSENGNGKVVTRREMAVRSAKIGAAAASAPLILSITAPTAMAAATPTQAQCFAFTSGSCGSGSGGCSSIAGCCCCCQGGSCKTCTTTTFCSPGNVTCDSGNANCSATGALPITNNRGCCGVDANNSSCGCGFDGPGVATFNADNGGPGTGAGCCDISQPPNGLGLFPTCVPSSTNANCVPCCNGVQIDPLMSLAGCCTSRSTTGNTGTCVVV